MRPQRLRREEPWGKMGAPNSVFCLNRTCSKFWSVIFCFLHFQNRPLCRCHIQLYVWTNRTNNEAFNTVITKWATNPTWWTYLPDWTAHSPRRRQGEAADPWLLGMKLLNALRCSLPEPDKSSRLVSSPDKVSQSEKWAVAVSIQSLDQTDPHRNRCGRLHAVERRTTNN